MDLKALDLAAESIRHQNLGGPSADSPHNNSVLVRPQSQSQPVSPAKMAGEPSRVSPTPQQPMNDCNAEKVSIIPSFFISGLKSTPHCI